MRLNFWNVLLLIVVLVIGIRLLRFLFGFFFAFTFRGLLPLVILALAAYGVYKLLERR